MKSVSKKKDVGDLRLKADEFDNIMRRALGVAPKQTAKSAPKKATSKNKPR